MNKAIFLDRDGTINVDFGYVYKTQELELLPGVAEALRIFQELGYLLIVITNQSGIGRGYFTLEDAEQFNRALAQELEKHGVILNDFYTCPHAPEEHCECRKPSPFMVTEAMKKYEIDPSQSYMFGDRNRIRNAANEAVSSLSGSQRNIRLYTGQTNLKNNLL